MNFDRSLTGWQRNIMQHFGEKVKVKRQQRGSYWTEAPATCSCEKDSAMKQPK
jgi:hypothetical protein